MILAKGRPGVKAGRGDGGGFDIVWIGRNSARKIG